MGRSLAQLAIARFGVAAAERRIVAVRVALHAFHRHAPPLRRVFIQQLVVFPRQHAHQALRQIVCIVNAAVHAHAARGIVHMGGVAEQQHIAHAKALCDALMHAIDRAHMNAILRGRAQKAADARANLRFGKRKVLVLIGPHAEHHAHQFHKLHDNHPFLGIENITYRPHAREKARKIQIAAHQQKSDPRRFCRRAAARAARAPGSLRRLRRTEKRPRRDTGPRGVSKRATTPAPTSSKSLSACCICSAARPVASNASRSSGVTWCCGHWKRKGCGVSLAMH